MYEVMYNNDNNDSVNILFSTIVVHSPRRYDLPVG